MRTWAGVRSKAFAAEPVLLPLIVFAGICAALAFVTVLATIVAALPDVVMSPVRPEDEKKGPGETPFSFVHVIEPDENVQSPASTNELTVVAPV